MIDAISVDPIKGIGIGLEYISDYVDEIGPCFVVILELVFIRIIFYTYTED